MAIVPVLNPHKRPGFRGEELVTRHRERNILTAGGSASFSESGNAGKFLSVLRPSVPHKTLKRLRASPGPRFDRVEAGTIGGSTSTARVPAKMVSPNSGNYAKRIANARASVEDHAAGGIETAALIASGAGTLAHTRPSETQQRIFGARLPPGTIVHRSSVAPPGVLNMDSRPYFGFPDNPVRFW